MQIQQFTEKAQAALQGAHSLALRMQHAEIGTLHLLLALAEQPEGLGANILQRLGFNVNALISGGRALLKRSPASVAVPASYPAARASTRRWRRPTPKPGASMTSTSAASTCSWHCWPGGATRRRNT